jgi:hypothetical protein
VIQNHTPSSDLLSVHIQTRSSSDIATLRSTYPYLCIQPLLYYVSMCCSSCTAHYACTSTICIPILVPFMYSYTQAIQTMFMFYPLGVTLLGCCLKQSHLLHGLSPRANYTDRATAACWRSDCQRFADRGCHVVSVTDPYGRILGFLGRSRYFSLK